MRFQVLTATSMMFRIVFRDDSHFTRQYIPEDNSENDNNLFVTSVSELSLAFNGFIDCAQHNVTLFPY
jgi:hypothetical protein